MLIKYNNYICFDKGYTVHALYKLFAFFSSSHLSLQHRNQVGVVIDEVIDISVCIGKMVLPVVCNSSPEGFILPVLDQTVQDCNTQHNDEVITISP